MDLEGRLLRIGWYGWGGVGVEVGGFGFIDQGSASEQIYPALALCADVNLCAVNTGYMWSNKIPHNSPILSSCPHGPPQGLGPVFADRR